MVTTKLNLSMTEPQVRQIYAKQGDTGRVLDISLDQTPEDGTLRILRPDGTEVTSEAVTGGSSESGETVTFESMTEADVTELTVGIEPVQDLNGYDAPWVGGAGKNKLNFDRATTTVNGITFTNNGDGTFTVSGTSTAVTVLEKQVTLSVAQGTQLILNGCPSGGSANTYAVDTYGTDINLTRDYGSGGTFTASGLQQVVRIVVFANVTMNNLVFKPMIRLATETDSTFAPYSNICPITGHDEVTVTDEGTNLLNYDAWKTVSITRGTAVWENNGVTLTATSTDCFTEWSNAAFPQGARVSVTEGETITLAWDATPTWLGNAYIFPNGQTSGMVTAHSDTGHLSYTVASGVTYLTFRVGVSSSGVTESYKNIQIVRGTTVPTWTPYVAPNTYTTSLGQTVYGGTLDLVSGVLTVDKAMVTAPTRGSLDSSGKLYRLNGISGQKSWTSTYVPTEYSITNQFSAQSLEGARQTGDKCFVQYGDGFYIGGYVGDTATLDTLLTTLQVVYELATPVEYQLTAQQIKTLVGTNNVWASSGDIISITFTYGGLLSELPSEATSVVGKCYCDIEQNGVSSMPFTLNVKKNERQ